MATLTDQEKVKIRNATERKAAEQNVPLTWVKGAINDAAQAIEDVFASASLQSAISTAIDNAASPYGVTFTAQEKRWLAALVMEVKHTRDIIG